MAIDKIFNDSNVDGIADNIFNAVNNSVSEVKQMQQRKAAENVQLVVQSLKKIDTDIREKFDKVTDVLEKRVSTIKDGRDGIDGKNGRDGKDGRNGKDGLNGKQGLIGPQGKDGVDGVDGVSVNDAHIDFDGSLIIGLSDGNLLNVGEVVSQDLANKIQVISTMSTNGAVGIKDEGSSISTGVKSINFVGATVTATNSGDDVTVNVSAGTGTVTSVAVSGGTTGLTTSGSPITTSGTITLAGTLAVANGGTGLTSFTSGGVVYASSTSALATGSNLSWDNSNVRLGLGTNTPNNRLEIAGATGGPALRITNTNGNSGIQILPDSTRYSWLLGAQFNVSNAFEITPSTAVGGTTFSTPALVVLQSGNVGIGTTSPDANLTVNGAASFAAGTALLPSIARAGDLNTGLWFPAADTIAASTGGTERLRITSAGDVGIGLSAPIAKLAVGGTNTNDTTANSINIARFSDGRGGAIMSSYRTDLTLPGDTLMLSVDAANPVDLTKVKYRMDVNGVHVWYGTTTSTERMRIDSSGNVLVTGTGTGSLGYGTGSGGTVTQGTSRTTGVTLSKPTGGITMFSAAGSATAATFTVTNTLVAATDTIILNQKSGTNLYVLLVTAVAAGSFNITFYTTGGTATDAPVINFALIKGVTA